MKSAKLSVPATQDSETSWVMFNDFLVKPVSEEEVFSFPGPWKIPAVIILVRKDVNDILETGNLPTQLEPSALFEDVSIAWNRRKHMVQHTVLASEELPGLGTLISIDAEFVALQQVSCTSVYLLLPLISLRKRWSSSQMVRKVFCDLRTCPWPVSRYSVAKARRRAYRSLTTTYIPVKSSWII